MSFQPFPLAGWFAEVEHIFKHGRNVTAFGPVNSLFQLRIWIGQNLTPIPPVQYYSDLTSCDLRDLPNIEDTPLQPVDLPRLDGKLSLPVPRFLIYPRFAYDTWSDIVLHFGLNHLERSVVSHYHTGDAFWKNPYIDSHSINRHSIDFPIQETTDWDALIGYVYRTFRTQSAHYAPVILPGLEAQPLPVSQLETRYQGDQRLTEKIVREIKSSSL